MKKILLILSAFVTVNSNAQVAFPITFETTTTIARSWDLAVAAVIDNPQKVGTNTSDKVLSITKPAGNPAATPPVPAAGDWAGCAFDLPGGGFNNSIGSGKISLRVFTTEPIGARIIVKVETEFGAGCIQQPPLNQYLTTTATGAWHYLTFNLETCSALEQLIIMPDAGTAGAGQVFLFDDIIQGEPPVPDDDDDDVTNTKSKSKAFTVSAYPNPAKQNWTISSGDLNINEITVYDVFGNQLITAKPNTTTATVDASVLSEGVYTAKISSGDRFNVIKLVKE